ncbi:MAG: hypothetical protein WC683_02015 [bacterium]
MHGHGVHLLGGVAPGNESWSCTGAGARSGWGAATGRPRGGRGAAAGPGGAAAATGGGTVGRAVGGGTLAPAGRHRPAAS